MLSKKYSMLSGVKESARTETGQGLSYTHHTLYYFLNNNFQNHLKVRSLWHTETGNREIQQK